MKNVVVLVDGTWNDTGKDGQKRSLSTNVVWLKDLCVDDKVTQVVWYTPGIGTDGWIDKTLGGAFGYGLTRRICEAYMKASEMYDPGDKLYFCAFSRGAYTVRTAADMIAKIGLVDLTDVKERQKAKLCKKIFDVYTGKSEPSFVSNLNFYNAQTTGAAPGSTKIEFVGVWDTVGTAGVPGHYRILNMFDGVSNKHNWGNTQLDEAVQHGRHAVGMDEMREAFVPAFWTDKNKNIVNDKRVVQLWFSGVHSDVGGGYENRDLGNISMAWMVEEAQKLGLLLVKNPERPIPPERAMGSVNDSLQSVFKRMWTRPRGVPNVMDKKNKALFHPSVLRRYNHNESPSVPSWNAAPLSIGQSLTQIAWANKRWTPLGIFVEPNQTYTISAKGTWNDGGRVFSPGGVWKNKADMPGSRLLDVHKLVNGISNIATWNRTGDEYRRVWGAWRAPNSKPFMLIGVIADRFGVRETTDPGGDPEKKVILPDQHTQFEIGDSVAVGPGTSVQTERGGYLYCFPNDVWSFYSNNSGSLSVTIRRDA